MENLKELLPIWAERAPDECTYGNDPKCSTDVNRPYYQVYRYDRLTWVGPRNADYREGFYTDVIQGAVQQAIEARGWFYDISYRGKQGYEAKVLSGDPFDANSHHLANSDHSPAIALLAAHVKALAEEVK